MSSHTYLTVLQSSRVSSNIASSLLFSIILACHYGDPQNRPRIIIFVSKPFVRLPSRPLRTHGPGLEPYVTTKEVLDHLRTPLAKSYPNMQDTKTTTKKAGEKDFLQLDPDGLAPTVLCSSSVAHYADKDRDGNFRPLNVRETSALQSFPFDYEFKGTLSEMYKQAGNAVPVNFARAIARSVRDALRYKFSEELDTQQGEADAETGAGSSIENEAKVDDAQIDMQQMTSEEMNLNDHTPPPSTASFENVVSI